MCMHVHLCALFTADTFEIQCHFCAHLYTIVLVCTLFGLFVHVCVCSRFNFRYGWQAEGDSTGGYGDLKICDELIFSKFLLAYFDALVEITPWYENLNVAESESEVVTTQPALLDEHTKNFDAFLLAVKEKPAPL